MVLLRYSLKNKNVSILLLTFFITLRCLAHKAGTEALENMGGGDQKSKWHRRTENLLDNLFPLQLISSL